jgi:hypothetical protein
MILEQGVGSGQTPVVNSILQPQPPGGMEGHRVNRGNVEQGRLRLQLLSLLARFQLISSPMVELVLETGCL